MHAFKTPQLYNLKDSPFYGHGGTFYSLTEVIDYKVQGLPAKAGASASLDADFQPLELTETEQAALQEFLEDALHDGHLDRYVPDALPSGHCFPNNDPQSSMDLGCNSPGRSSATGDHEADDFSAALRGQFQQVNAGGESPSRRVRRLPCRAARCAVRGGRRIAEQELGALSGPTGIHSSGPRWGSGRREAQRPRPRRSRRG